MEEEETGPGGRQAPATVLLNNKEQQQEYSLGRRHLSGRRAFQFSKGSSRAMQTQLQRNHSTIFSSSEQLFSWRIHVK
jgi:hypothetical protein